MKVMPIIAVAIAAIAFGAGVYMVDIDQTQDLTFDFPVMDPQDADKDALNES